MKCYHVDAFADRLFEGNPACVCVLEQWPADALMQKIAMENNLSETAFAVREGNRGSHYRLRWFTPTHEIDLCGHATLATAFVLANFFEPEQTVFRFQTLSGELVVTQTGKLFEMDFPAYPLRPVAVTTQMEKAIGFKPREAWLGRDLVCVLEDGRQVQAAQPDMEALRDLDGLLLHITAPGPDNDCDHDCISRSFAPKLGVAEDPVCGSGHCHIAPLWAEKTGKTVLSARQASARGGTLLCTVQANGRVLLAGSAVLYSVAELAVA